MNESELKATMARLDAEEAAGIHCDCYKCHIEGIYLYPGVSDKPRPKKKRVPGPKKQSESDLHEEHGS